MPPRPSRSRSNSRSGAGDCDLPQRRGAPARLRGPVGTLGDIQSPSSTCAGVNEEIELHRNRGRLTGRFHGRPVHDESPDLRDSFSLVLKAAFRSWFARPRWHGLPCRRIKLLSCRRDHELPAMPLPGVLQVAPVTGHPVTHLIISFAHLPRARREQAAGAAAITLFRPPHCILRKAHRDDHSRLVLFLRPCRELIRYFVRGILHIGGVGRRRRGLGRRCWYRRRRRSVSRALRWPDPTRGLGQQAEISPAIGVHQVRAAQGNPRHPAQRTGTWQKPLREFP